MGINLLTGSPGVIYGLYLEGELVDFTKINLQSEYQKWNAKLFNNELPKISMSFKKIKKASGVTTANAVRVKKGSKVLKSVSDLSIAISTNLKLTQEEFDGILIHEMIHVWFLNNLLDEKHGLSFKAKASELSKKAGFTIPLTHEIKNSEVNSAGTPKVLAFILVIRPTGSPSLAFFSDKKIKEVTELPTRLSRGVPTGTQVITGTVKTILGDKYIVFRSLKAIKTVSINKSEAESIINSADITRSEIK